MTAAIHYKGGRVQTQYLVLLVRINVAGDALEIVSRPNRNTPYIAKLDETEWVELRP